MASTVNQRARIHLLQAIGLAGIALFVLTRPVVEGEVHEVMEMAGLGLLLVCFGGRIWSILYVGGRKSQELVTTGPYSVTRNPLYLFSVIGAVGAGLVFGSVVVAVLAGFVAWLVMSRTAMTEAAFLSNRFGAAYDAYSARTPLFWPRPSLYRDEGKVEFSTAALTRTFFDGLYFLAVFPILEGIEMLQSAGWLPTLLTVY